MERSGHECAGHVEIDKYANISYMAMYELNSCRYGKKDRICREGESDQCDGINCKGEWFAKDIKQIRSGEIPKAEIWTFGFPCTDISLSGRRAGLAGERSGLFYSVIGLLKSTPATSKPGVLIIENVKSLLSSKRGRDFTSVLFELWEAGYDAEWMCVNSKDFGVPQHRERVYLIGHLRGKCGREIFPIHGTKGASLIQVIGGRQGMRVYDMRGLSVTLTASAGGFGGRTGLYASFIDMNENPMVTKNARCIKAKQNSGIVNHRGEISGVICCQEFPVKSSRIRRLTPRECWRLQSFEDDLFDRARAAGISDAQLYKQAGNAVTVNIVYEIGRNLQRKEEEKALER